MPVKITHSNKIYIDRLVKRLSNRIMVKLEMLIIKDLLLKTIGIIEHRVKEWKDKYKEDSPLANSLLTIIESLKAIINSAKDLDGLEEGIKRIEEVFY